MPGWTTRRHTGLRHTDHHQHDTQRLIDAERFPMMPGMDHGSMDMSGMDGMMSQVR